MFFILSLNLKIKEIIKILSLPYVIIKKVIVLFKSKKKSNTNIDNTNLDVDIKDSSDNILKERQQILPFAINKEIKITGNKFKLPPINFLERNPGLNKSKNNNNIEDSKNIISHGKLRLDPSQLECEWDGKQLPDKLTTTEFLIVKELAKRPGIIKERAQLMDIAYKDNNDIEDRTIDSHVKRIRKKFKKVDQNFSAIETRYGSGYRWNVS